VTVVAREAVSPHAPPRVPFLDLTSIHAELKDAILSDLAGVVDAGTFTNGPAVRDFEAAFAAYCGSVRAVGLASGLDALRLGLAALDVGPGDEVLVPASTFVATWEAVTQIGAIPVPVDVTTSDYGLDVTALGAAVTRGTRAVVPVHLYGQMADMGALLEVASRHDLLVVEDACQAHGAERDGHRAGSAGDAGAFSFYPGKNLGAFGDAGALVTNDEAVADRVVALREHGQRGKYRHAEPGWTARLDTVQAVVLGHKLAQLDAWNAARRAIASAYAASLDGVGDLVLPAVPEASSPVWHLYVVRTGSRDELAAFLAERGIATGLHYPEPPHLTAAYASLGYERGAFPVSESIASQVLSLPIFPGMTEGQVEAVVEGVLAFFRGGV
jgi:dTDP-4-amino-4,6-dideoxygalactose transaminase